MNKAALATQVGSPMRLLVRGVDNGAVPRQADLQHVGVVHPASALKAFLKVHESWDMLDWFMHKLVTHSRTDLLHSIQVKLQSPDVPASSSSRSVAESLHDHYVTLYS